MVAFDVFQYKGEFVLESGVVLSGYQLGYTTYGQLNQAKDNVVWIFHALTANSDPAEWWPSLVGEGKCFDPAQDFIVCVNMPGSCYGSLGPLDVNTQTGKKYYHDFPFFTPRDMVRSYRPLLKHLGIDQIKVGIGGSMGGQQLLEWAIEDPELFDHIFLLATNAVHSPWGKAFNASQRFCIENDPGWKEDRDDAGIEGMKIARSIALLSYRHYNTYEDTQKDLDHSILDHFKSESYQRYQGEKLAKRFNAFSYYFLSQGMDSHNVGRGRGGIEKALKKILAHTVVMGIESDLLFPVQEQQFLASQIPGATFHSIHSFYGHDGFLLEFDQIQKIIQAALVNC